MLISIQPIRWVSGIVFGLIITPISVEAVTLQRSFQEAFVKGNKNKVEQEVNQKSSEFFEIKAELSTDLSIRFNLNSENQKTTLIEQLSGQETTILGTKNKVTQAINQTQVNIFSVSADFLVNEASLIEPLFLESDRLIETDQFGFQDTLIVGDSNNVLQKINQTLISLFFIEDNLSSVWEDTALDKPISYIFQNPFQDLFLQGKRNRVEQNISQDFIEAFFIKPDSETEFLVNLDWGKFTNLEAIEWLVQEENLSLYKIRSYSSHISALQLSQPILEPSTASGLLALGIGGASLILVRKIK